MADRDRGPRKKQGLLVCEGHKGVQICSPVCVHKASLLCVAADFWRQMNHVQRMVLVCTIILVR